MRLKQSVLLKEVTCILALLSPRLSRSQLRIFALAAMTADHLAWAFLPTVSPVSALVHLVGRTAMPVFCFLLAEGSLHSRSLPQYALRLAGCALLSAIPYSLFQTQQPFALPFSAVYTLLIGLAALRAAESRLPVPLCILALTVLLLAALPGDWGVYGVGWCLIFSLARDRKTVRDICFSLLVVLHFLFALLPLLGQGLTWEALFCYAGIQLGSLLALPLFRLYDGSIPVNSTPLRRILSYFYYPLHLIIIDLFLLLR